MREAFVTIWTATCSLSLSLSLFGNIPLSLISFPACVLGNFFSLQELISWHDSNMSAVHRYTYKIYI